MTETLPELDGKHGLPLHMYVGCALLVLAMMAVVLAFWLFCVVGLGGTLSMMLEYSGVMPLLTSAELQAYRLLMSVPLCLFALVCPVTLLLIAPLLSWLWRCSPLRDLRSWQSRRLLESAVRSLVEDLPPDETIEFAVAGRLPGGQSVAALTMTSLPLTVMLGLLLCVIPFAILLLLEGRYSMPLVRSGNDVMPYIPSPYLLAVFAVCLLGRVFVPACPVLIGSSIAYALPAILLLPGPRDSLAEGKFYEIMSVVGLWRTCAPYLCCLLMVDLFCVFYRDRQYVVAATSARLIVTERRTLRKKWTVRFHFDKACRIHFSSGMLESVLILQQEEIGRFVCALTFPESFGPMLKYLQRNHEVLPHPRAWQLTPARGRFVLVPVVMLAAFVVMFASIGSQIFAYAVGLWFLVIVPYDDFRVSGRPETAI